MCDSHEICPCIPFHFQYEGEKVRKRLPGMIALLCRGEANYNLWYNIRDWTKRKCGNLQTIRKLSQGYDTRPHQLTSGHYTYNTVESCLHHVSLHFGMQQSIVAFFRFSFSWTDKSLTMTAKLLSIRNDLIFCLGVFAYIDLFTILLVHLFAYFSIYPRRWWWQNSRTRFEFSFWFLHPVFFITFKKKER